MEFERALFRIYEKSVRSLFQQQQQQNMPYQPQGIGNDRMVVGNQVRAGQRQQALNQMQVNRGNEIGSNPSSTSEDIFSNRRILLMIILFCCGLFISSVLLLITMHVSFVGNGSCLMDSLESQYGKNTLYHGDNGLVLVDPVDFNANRSSYIDTFDDKIRMILLQDDLIRIRAFHEDAENESDEKESEKESTVAVGSEIRTNFLRKLDDGSEEDSPSLSIENSDSLTNDKDVNIQVGYDDYEFSASPSMIAMKPELRDLHNVRMINITLPSSCVGSSYLWRKFVYRYVGTDDIVINSLMHGLHSNGVLKNIKTGELWTWSSQLVESYERRHGIARLIRNIGYLGKSLIQFLMMSSVTAILVRILISSGVSLLFPLFYFFRWIGLHDLNSRVLVISYPWLGAQISMLQSIGASIYPLISAHMIFVFVFYMIYEA